MFFVPLGIKVEAHVHVAFAEHSLRPIILVELRFESLCSLGVVVAKAKVFDLGNEDVAVLEGDYFESLHRVVHLVQLLKNH